MTRAILVLALIAAAATPEPARALLLPDQVPVASCARSDAIVHMPCESAPPQLQTLRTSLVRSLVPMNCRVTGVRLNLAGIPINAGGGAGLVAAAIVPATWHSVHVEQLCQPAH